MGVDAVVIVENSRNRTLEEFKALLLQDEELGRLLWDPFEISTGELVSQFQPWEAFEWEGKKYFSWIASPRAFYLNLYKEEGEEPTPIQITFFRCMLLVEQAAGGPIYVGNDVVYHHTPFDFPEEPFWLPGELDALWPNWREIARIPLAPDEFCLIF